jgi:hypothetical protein
MECILLLTASGITTVLCIAVWFLMKGDTWRWTKLAAGIVSFVVFILIAQGIIFDSRVEAYITIAAILIVEEAINAVGQIIRQIYLRKRRKCLLSIFRQEPA